MVQLFGKNFTQRQLAERGGSLSQFAGVRLMTLGDGVERGIRMLEFRTGSGLRFTLLIDRAMDIAELEVNGQAIGWHSPSGFRHPALHEYGGENGLAWARSFSGFLVTCGLDHILGPETVPSDNYRYPGRKTITHSLHGRVSTIPAKLTGYGETWNDEQCTLWAEGIVQQATVFGENLHLIRRIEADVGTNEVRLTDRVINMGFRATPHMYFLHVNAGYPLLDEGTHFVAPISDVIWAAHAGRNYRQQGVGYRKQIGPRDDFVEQVWQHELKADAQGMVPVALINDNLALGLELTTHKEQLPCFYQWQNLQAGEYAMGLEPSTHHAKGNNFARERGEMIWLAHGDERRYDTKFRVLQGKTELAEAKARISAIARQPEDEYPEPSNSFVPLQGPGRRKAW